MLVLKFGGTSVGSCEAIRRVVEIVRSRLPKGGVTVVVSAFSGVTDMLYKMVAAGVDQLPEIAKALEDRHFAVAKELFRSNPGQGVAVRRQIKELIDAALQICLDGMRTQSGLSDRDKAAVISTGELLSSRVVCAALQSGGISASWVDVRQMMIATGDPLKSEPDIDELVERAPQVMNAAFATEGVQAVVTQGFICASAGGRAALLGRGGSDYSASLLGMALGAQAVEIWTDVDGVRTADPRKVATTRCLKCISYEQAAEMARFGAKVLHPLTLEPAKRKNIPVYVLNTNNPDGQKTAILCREKARDEVKSVSYKAHVDVITMQPRQSMESSAFMKKVFDIFGEAKVALDLVSTNNSRLSVTVDPQQKHLEEALGRIEEFADTVRDSTMSQISAICTTATGMNTLLSMSFAPLRDCRIYMISPGASCVNISFVVKNSSLDEVVGLTHKYLIENESSN